MSHPNKPISKASASSGDPENSPAARTDQTQLVAALLLLFAVAFNLYHLYPEVAIQIPMFNDGALHLPAMKQVAASLAAGQNPTDVWLGVIGLGYPLFHHYQHLAYLPPALLHHLTGLSLPGLFHWTRYLLLSLFPLSIYWSMRRFGFDCLSAAMAGLLAPLIATDGLFGFDFASYVWRGSGLYTQLWGMFLLPPTLAQSYVTLRTGRGYIWATLLLAATLLAHLVFGYIAMISLAVFVVVDAHSSTRVGLLWQRLKRLTLLLVLLILVTAYFLIPFWLDRTYMNRSVWEEAGKYNAYGHQWVMGALARGELFDFGRFPILTLLVGLGLARCLWRRQEERYRLPVALTLFWLLLYFGRPTWGPLLDFLPLSGDLHFHRLIAGFHLGGIYLMGLGLAWPWQWVLTRPGTTWEFAPNKQNKIRALLQQGLLPVTASITILLLAPAYAERGAYLAQNTQWMAKSQAALAAEAQDVTGLMTTLQNLPPGRVYAGLGNNWGRDYKVGAVPVYALLTEAGLDNLGYLYHALSLNADIQVLFDETRAEHYNLFNVRYVVAPVDHPWPDFVRPIGDFGRHRLYQVTTSGYFDLVGTDVAFTGHKDDFYPAASTWLNSHLLPAKQHPALFFKAGAESQLSQLPLPQAGQILPQLSLPLPSEPIRGHVLSEAVESGTYRAEVEVARESTLLLKTTYHPNWHAYVDGVEVEPLMVMPSFLGVRVAPGPHQIHLEYRPRPLRGILLAVGLPVLLVTALAEWRPAVLFRWIERLGLSHQSDRSGHSGWGANLPFPRLQTPFRITPSPTQKQPGIDFKTKLGLYLLFFSIYFMSGAGHFFSTDHVSVYLTTQSLVQHHNLAIEPIHDTAIGPDGRSYSVFGVGQSVLSIPLYLVGSLVDNLSSPQLKALWGGPDLGNWGGTTPIFFVSLFNQFITPLTCVLVFLFCLQLGFSGRRSFVVTLIFGFGTAAWVYARDYFQHPLESLCLLLSIYILFTNRNRLHPRHALLSGLALALGILTRINLLLVVPIIAIYLLSLILKRRQMAQPTLPSNQIHLITRITGIDASRLWPWSLTEGVWQYLLLFGLPIALILVLILYFNQIRFGYYLEFNPIAMSKSRPNPIWIGLYGYFLSPGRSIFLYSPPLILALFTFQKFYRRYQAEAILFLALFMMYVILYAFAPLWHGGWSWGPRYFLAIIPLFIIPTGYFLDTRRNVAIAIFLTGLGVGIQIVGIAINYSFIHWDWLRIGFSQENPAYLFLPDLSPIPMHLKALQEWRYVDLWVLWVYRQFGLPIFLVTILGPLLLMLRGLKLLKHLYRPESGQPARWLSGKWFCPKNHPPTTDLVTASTPGRCGHAMQPEPVVTSAQRQTL